MAILVDAYPGSTHVATVGRATVPDERIWEYAAANAFVIVTKDDDFRQRSFLRGFPPKVIWLQFGNCSTELIASTLGARCADVVALVADPEKALLILSRVQGATGDEMRNPVTETTLFR